MQIQLQIYTFQCDYHKKRDSAHHNLLRFVGERLNNQSGSGEEYVLLLVKSPQNLVRCN